MDFTNQLKDLRKAFKWAGAEKTDFCVKFEQWLHQMSEDASHNIYNPASPGTSFKCGLVMSISILPGLDFTDCSIINFSDTRGFYDFIDWLVIPMELEEINKLPDLTK